MATGKSNNALTIRILGRDYSVACPEGEREALLNSAEYVSKRMQSIQRRGKTLGMEKIAVMAALNMARDLMETERELAAKSAEPGQGNEVIRQRLAQMQLKIDSTLDETD